MAATAASWRSRFSRATVAAGVALSTALGLAVGRDRLEQNNQTVMHYAKDGRPAKGEFPYNPNGAARDIASICDPTGRVMGMMPHPERNILFTQRDDYTAKREEIIRKGGTLPEESEGIELFRNGVRYFK